MKKFTVNNFLMGGLVLSGPIEIFAAEIPGLTSIGLGKKKNTY